MKYIIRFEDGDNTYPFMCEDEEEPEPMVAE